MPARRSVATVVRAKLAEAEDRREDPVTGDRRH